MTRIAEKPGFMKMRAVKVYKKTEIEMKAKHQKPCFRTELQQNYLGKKILDSSR